MADIKQKAVHSNGYTANWRYTDWGDWSRSSYTARSSWPYTADWGYDSGGYYYTDYGQYYRNRNYWENTNDGVVNTVNYSPKLANGSALLTSSQYGTATITIDLSKLTYTDTESNAATKWKIFKAFSSNGTSFGAWTQLAEISTKSYTWTVTSETAGYYKIAVTVYDGYSWSALLSNGSFVAHHIENGNVNTTAYDTISYAESSVFKIVHYTPPTWLTDYYTVAQMDQLKTEVNKARTSFGLQSYTFTTASIVADFTPITAKDIQELQTAANDVYKSEKGSDYTFADKINNTDTNKTVIVKQNLIDIQNLLDSLVDTSGGGSSTPTETWVTQTGTHTTQTLDFNSGNEGQTVTGTTFTAVKPTKLYLKYSLVCREWVVAHTVKVEGMTEAGSWVTLCEHNKSLDGDSSNASEYTMSHDGNLSVSTASPIKQLRVYINGRYWNNTIVVKIVEWQVKSS